MKVIKLVTMVALAFFVFVGTADAQKKAKGPTIVQLDILIHEVGEATIGYQTLRRGRMRTSYIGVADVTRVQKAKYKDIALKDLKKGDKALVTLYKNPDDPYFPALSIKVYGKGVAKARRSKKKKKK